MTLWAIYRWIRVIPFFLFQTCSAIHIYGGHRGFVPCVDHKSYLFNFSPPPSEIVFCSNFILLSGMWVIQNPCQIFYSGLITIFIL